MKLMHCIYGLNGASRTCYNKVGSEIQVLDGKVGMCDPARSKQ